jgi:hypothetical protein
MKQKEIEEFLRQRPGYLKKGPGSLALHLGADVNKCKKALSKVKKELRYPKEKENEENLVLKSKWQAQTKEGLIWMESYRNVDDDPVPLTTEDWKEIISEIGGIQTLHSTETKLPVNRSLIVWSSDKHIGSKIPSDALYKKQYNEHIFHNRMVKIYEKVMEHYRKYGKFDKLVLADLGDALDGFNKKTTRGGHELPQNLNNKEAARVHFFTHKWFYDSLIKADIANEVLVWNITNDNHSGDFGWQACFGLQQYGELAWPDVEFVNQEEFLGHFTLYDKAYITTHGKDKKNRFKGLPLALDDKTANFIIDYVFDRKLTNYKIHVRKGDLHQNMIDCSNKKMSYFNVGSVFGSSDWIMDNFSDGNASCALEVVEENGNDIYPSIVWL